MSAWCNCRFAGAVAVAISLLLAAPCALGQDVGPKPDKPAEKDAAPKPKKPPERKPQGSPGDGHNGAADAYGHELSAGIDYDLTKGAVKSADDTEETQLSESKIGVSLFYGALLTDHIEPVFEVTYSVVNRKVDDFESKSSVLDLGAGIFVNLPQVDEAKFPDHMARRATTPEIMMSDWIPFVGFLVGTSRSSEEQGVPAAQGTLTDGGTYTKLAFGTRWMVVPHVTLNFVAKVLYEKSESEAEAGAKTGASRSKLRVETNLLSMSLFL